MRKLNTRNIIRTDSVILESFIRGGANDEILSKKEMLDNLQENNIEFSLSFIDSRIEYLEKNGYITTDGENEKGEVVYKICNKIRIPDDCEEWEAWMVTSQNKAIPLEIHSYVKKMMSNSNNEKVADTLKAIILSEVRLNKTIWSKDIIKSGSVDINVNDSLFFRHAVQHGNIKMVNFLLPHSDINAGGGFALLDTIHRGDWNMFNLLFDKSDKEINSFQAIRKAAYKYAESDEEEGGLKDVYYSMVKKLTPHSDLDLAIKLIDGYKSEYKNKAIEILKNIKNHQELGQVLNSDFKNTKRKIARKI